MEVKNTTIILTHPVDSNDQLADHLVRMGIEVVHDPMIDTQPISLTPAEIKDICNADLLLFTSKRGVKYTTSQINPVCCQDKKVAVVGKKTATALNDCNVKPYFISQGQTGEDMCRALIEDGFIKGKKVVALLAQLADHTIEEYLSDVCNYKRIDIYKTISASAASGKTKEVLFSGKNVLVSFTSSSAVKTFFGLYHQFELNRVKYISIGPKTTESIIEAGYTDVIEAEVSTYDGLLHIIKEHLNINAITE